jgi:hypothetical protein
MQGLGFKVRCDLRKNWQERKQWRSDGNGQRDGYAVFVFFLFFSELNNARKL